MRKGKVLLLPWFVMQPRPFSYLSLVASMRPFLLCVPMSLFLVATGCVSPVPRGDDDDSQGDDDDSVAAPVDFRFWSPDFEDAELLPTSFECYQSNPEMQWEGLPEGTVALALIFDDPTAGNFPHWAIYNIPPTETGLAAGISGDGITNTLPAGASELENGFQFDGYLGSCPCGASPNTYRWRLWALDSDLDSPSSGSSSTQFSSLAAAAEDASLDMLELSHRYGPATICP